MTQQRQQSSSRTGPQARAARKSPVGCWVDVFDGPVFSGKLRRLRGPAQFRGLEGRAISPGSLIVGPEAVLVVQRTPKPVSLHPKQVIPEVAKTRLAGAIEDFKIVTADSKTGS